MVGFSFFCPGYKLRAIPELPAGETQSLRFEARIRPWPTLLRDLSEMPRFLTVGLFFC